VNTNFSSRSKKEAMTGASALASIEYINEQKAASITMGIVRIAL
jgi:hypothetical protein